MADITCQHYSFCRCLHRAMTKSTFTQGPSCWLSQLPLWEIELKRHFWNPTSAELIQHTHTDCTHTGEGTGALSTPSSCSPRLHPSGGQLLGMRCLHSPPALPHPLTCGPQASDWFGAGVLKWQCLHKSAYGHIYSIVRFCLSCTKAWITQSC